MDTSLQAQSVNLPFGSVSASGAHHAGEGRLLPSVQRFKCCSRAETPSQTHAEIIFYQLSGHPLANT